jgi:demethylmenaquinone methyltransferase/2-methoxy-6-polyprenyl-1,4-benzoquinol methylase
MVPDKQETRDLYRRRARRYDLAMWLYRLCGFRIDHYRRQAVAALALRPGDTVVELGCGTGLNFAMLQRLVGPSGRVIGVDLTDAMLAEAKRRVDRAGWTNVELVQADLAEYTCPDGVGGFLSTLALTLVPEFDAVIQTVSRKLRPGGRLAVLDMKLPDGWPEWLVRFVAWLNGPYGVIMELAERHPWESVRRSLRQVEYREFYFGALYLSVGEARTRSQRPAAS